MTFNFSLLLFFFVPSAFPFLFSRFCVFRGSLMAGLYIHIPFCVRKCRYCDFYSVPVRRRDGLRSRFLQALDIELQKLPKDFLPQTIFIGGGTPTSLDAPELAGLFESVKKRVDVSKVTEWSCEANPGTLDWEKAKLLRDAGVNRVSLGVQSFDPQNLAFLGRIHSSTEAKDAYQLLRDAGFENINVDLMYGIPGSSREILERDLALIANLDPEHVACYCLMFEEGTELTRLRDAGSVAEIEDEEELEQYRLIRGDARPRRLSALRDFEFCEARLRVPA